MAILPVKWYDNRFHGIPQMTGTPGSMTAIMDAILVDGFGQTNVVAINVLNKKATFILEDGVTFFKKSVIAISGFSNTTLNGEYRIEETDVGRFVITMDALDGPLDALNVKVKYASLGWFKPFSAVSKGIYKPSQIDALNWYFCVDDAQALITDVRLCEKPTDFGNLGWTKPVISQTFYWRKSALANTSANAFAFVGDGYSLYYKTSNQYTSGFTDRNVGDLLFMGEGVRLSNVHDPFAVYITGRNYTTGNAYDDIGNIFNSHQDRKHVLRDLNGNKIHVPVYTSVQSTAPLTGFTSTVFSGDGQVRLSNENYIFDTSRRMCRFPGLIIPLSNTYAYNNFDQVVEAKDNTFNRDLLYARSSSDSANITLGTNPRQYYFDITGPWR